MLFLHMPSLLGMTKFAFTALALYLAHIFIHAFLFSPTRHIPGPWLARISRLPLLRATLQRRRTEYATQLLAKYGPVVILAPNQIHTTDDKAMQVIYNKRSRKTSFYANMGSWKGVTSTLGFITYPEAAPTRNNLIQCFQNKNLATLVRNMSSHIAEFCDIIRARQGEDLDGVVLFRLLALDIVTDVLWGETKTLLSEFGDSTPVFLRRFHAFSSYNALKSFVPGLDSYVRWFGSKAWRELRQDCSDMDVTAKEALVRWDAEEEHRDRDVLSMLRSMDQGKGVPSEHITAYMVEMMAAGSSTTSHTATFCCWILTRYPDQTRKLREELKTALPDRRNFDERKMVELRYLQAVLYETMRLIPMIPGPLERYLGEDITINGIHIPAGTIASTAAYNQGRLPDIFPDPEAFIPERWLPENTPAPQLERMHLNWTPFGYGSRACPASNMAMTELKYIIGTIFRLFDVELPREHVQDKLDLADVFVAGERSGHCWLRFVETED